VVLERGLAVEAVVWVLVAAYVVSGIASVIVVAAWAPSGSGRASVAGSWRLVKDSAPFLGIHLATSLRGNIGTILVSGFLGEVAVGLFNAANQLTVPVRLVCENLVTSFFPAMVRRHRT